MRKMSSVVGWFPSKRLGFLVLASISLCAPTSLALAQAPGGLQRADGAAIPVRFYAPANHASCAPTMILSHGFGGDQNGLSALGAAMSSKGWRVIAVAHRESGREALRSAFMGGGGLGAVEMAARDRGRHAARFADLDAAYGEATRACRPPRLVLAGHSMGSQTTMMEAGARPLIGGMGSNRFDAYIALSPQGIGTTYAAGAWTGVRKPVLMITGTNDRVPDGDYTARLTAFDGLPSGNKRLAVIAGAGHMQLGGNGGGDVSAVVNALVSEFLDQVPSGRLSPSRVSGATVLDK